MAKSKETPERVECSVDEVRARKAELVAKHGLPVSTVIKGTRAVLTVVRED